MSNQVYLALGSNLGDRSENLKLAREALPINVRLVEASPIYETAPWGFTDQPDFLNQVIRVETDLSPKRLLKVLKKLETKIGRKPSIRYGPRAIDIDILFYDDHAVQSTELTIPHPRLEERAFVLVPLADLAPDLKHPLTGETVREMLAKIEVNDISKY